MTAAADEPAWVYRHPHEPNPHAPPGDGSFHLVLPGGALAVPPERLHGYPFFEVDDCYIVSTGHGTSGPFRFGGVRLLDLLRAELPRGQKWDVVDVVSADGFGARLARAALEQAPAARPPLLATRLDGAPLSRAQGLVRLIVPTETGDALLQVKWVERVTVPPARPRAGVKP